MTLTNGMLFGAGAVMLYLLLLAFFLMMPYYWLKGTITSWAIPLFVLSVLALSAWLALLYFLSR